MTRILLLVELKGGNDGLNTLVPYADPLYRVLRPEIGVPREQVIQLDEKVGLHPRLASLAEAWQAADLAIVQGVGYPEPNRSHFRSIEIWDTALQAAGEGWIARAMAHTDQQLGIGVDGIAIDLNAQPLTGRALRVLSIADAQSFLDTPISTVTVDDNAADNPALRHVLAVRRDAIAAAAGVRSALRTAPAPTYDYEADEPFGRQLDLATRLVAARLPLRAVKIGLDGFDTHANQTPTHDRLLAALGEGLATFRRNMIAAGRWDEVFIMTYSEFGRRAAQNGSGGTDHGTAAPLFAMGGRIVGGLHGLQPPLAELEGGDLRYTVDFRDVYSTVARGCWVRDVTFGQRSRRTLSIFAT